jgi:hypothetical protein
MTAIRSPAAAGLLLAAALALTGCGGAGQTGDGEPELGDMLRVSDAKTISLPLDAYLNTPATGKAVNQARVILFARCMQRFGFEVHPPAAVNAPPPPANDGRYGLADLAEAQRHGYHPARTSSPAATTEQEMSPAAEAVAEGNGERIQGLPEGGCLGEARRKMAAGAPSPPDPEAAERLALNSHARAAQDSRVRAAVDKWSACMRRAGYDYAHPMKANDDPRFQTDRPSTREIAVATADVRCKQEVNLIGISVTVESAYQRQAIERNAEALRAVKALREAQVRNAARILDGA